MRLMSFFLVIVVCAALVSAYPAGKASDKTVYDLVLANGRIVDGCGNPWFSGDLAIQDGRIATIAPAGTLQGKQKIDIAGRYISPGFIDIHTHSDLSIMINRRGESAVRQGVTTHVIGNCGSSPAPVDDAHLAEIRGDSGSASDQPGVSWKWRTFNEYLNALQDGGLGLNIAALVGHGALRIAARGGGEGAATAAELDKMKSLLDEAMRAGAFGMSTGLVYPPGCYADTDEIIALARVLAPYHGIYATHIRGERETILLGVEEAIRIGREAGVPVQVSHNAPKFGAPCDAHGNLKLIDEARSRGQDVTVDNDVHTDLAPSLTGGLPQEIQSLSEAEIGALLRDPAKRAAIRQEIVADLKPAFGPVGLLKHGQWQRVTMMYAPKSPEVIGKTIQVIAQERGRDPFDTYFDLILANGHKAEAIFDYIDEADIRILLQHPAVMICSDGEALALDGVLNNPPPYSPCSYGEFPGVLERYVREKPVLTLQEAIRKMTSFPAQRLGLFDRGILRPGAWADIVVFDLDRIHDRATNLYPHTYPFVNYPHQYPEGIDYVFVNGVMVVNGKDHTGALPGKVLRRS